MIDQGETALPGACGADLSRDLRSGLSGLRVLARRFVLATPGVEATVPMLRGVWGAALHDRASEIYATVFEGLPGAERDGSGSEKRPLYVLRPAPVDPVDSPALEWISLGAALDHDASLLEAWMEAAACGLGPDRVPMAVWRVRRLTAEGRVTPTGLAGGFRLHAVPWPLPGPPETTPCRLRFDVPVRLLRKGRLITEPSLTDIAVAGLRRLQGLAESEEGQAGLKDLQGAVRDAARQTSAHPWVGQRAHLHRYSANQGELDLRGVTGLLDLPQGPGPLWPLLAALTWVHVGKGTVFGLGHVLVEPLG